MSWIQNIAGTIANTAEITAGGIASTSEQEVAAVGTLGKFVQATTVDAAEDAYDKVLQPAATDTVEVASDVAQAVATPGQISSTAG